MEDNSNSATLIDHRPVSLRAGRAHQLPFRGPADVNEFEFAPWDEQRDEFLKIQSPLSTIGFMRLGGLNHPSSNARKNGNHRGSSQHANDDVTPLAHVKPSFRPPESAVCESPESGLVRGSAALTATTAASTSTIPGTDHNTVSGAMEEDSAQI